MIKFPSFGLIKSKKKSLNLIKFLILRFLIKLEQFAYLSLELIPKPKTPELIKFKEEAT